MVDEAAGRRSKEGAQDEIEPRERGRASPPANAVSRRETGILAAAVTAVPLLVASGISVIPQLDGVWPTAVGIAVLVVIVVVVGVQIVRSARKLLVGEGVDADFVAYTDDRETGILLKGRIANVSLRTTTIHQIVDTLTEAIPSHARQDALYRCGCQVGESWVDDFRSGLTKLEIEKDDIFRQMLKWAEYDATAGMGRLTIAVNPTTGEGLVSLANSFLSRQPSSFPLNWWFAGYLAGSLRELLGREVQVSIVSPSTRASATILFTVAPKSAAPNAARRSGRPRDPRSVARGPVWIARLKRPLPNEAG